MGDGCVLADLRRACVVSRFHEGVEVVTKQEFETFYAKNSNVSEEEIDEMGFFAVSCDCGDDTCRGWKMTTKWQQDMDETMRQKFGM